MYKNVSFESIQNTLKAYKGIWRRFEILGTRNNALIVSDYGHHPTEIENTIKGAKAFYPEKRIVLVFQPHQHDRVKKLFNDFIPALSIADVVIMVEIFDVVGREETGLDVSSKDIAENLEKQGKETYYAKSLNTTKELILDVIKQDDVVIVMGAGDVYKVAEDLVKHA